jgi:hypothetical protein
MKAEMIMEAQLRRFLPLMLVWALVACSSGNGNSNTPEKSKFDQEMDRAMELAQKFGPITQALAEETAKEYSGCVTPLNIKTRESAERKCKTDQCMPFDLKDLARTTVVAAWDSADISEVIDYLIILACKDSIFGRYKHQNSDYGYWGDIVNLKFVENTDTLYTEIQLKTYSMYYGSGDEKTVRATIGEENYQYIHSVSGLEPGLFHVYYEIIRADTSSEATIAYYKQLSREYNRVLQSVPQPNK